MRGWVCHLQLLLVLAREFILGVRVPWDCRLNVYCLRFETFLFIPSYNSQVYGCGIRPHLHTGISFATATAATLYLRGVPNREHRVEQSAIHCYEIDTSVVQETFVYVAVRTVLIEPLAGNGRLASTPIFRLSGRVYRALLNNRLFQLVVSYTRISKPLPMQWIHLSQCINNQFFSWIEDICF
jgi:hypothetical protein